MSTKDYYELIESTVFTFKQSDYAKTNNVRLWVYDNTGQVLLQAIKDQTKDLSSNEEMMIELQAELVPKDEKLQLKDALKLDNNPLIIVEFKDSKKGWCVKNNLAPFERRCEECDEWKEIKDMVTCVCKKVFYCSDECMQRNEYFHQNKCDKINSDDETMMALEKSEKSVNGVCVRSKQLK